MVKRSIAYILLIVANFVLLAHAIIPHRHHERQVCFEKTNYVNDECSHSHNSPDEDHQHGNNSKSDACLLYQAIILPASQDRILKSCHNCNDYHNHDFFITSDFGDFYVQPVFKNGIYIPEFPSFFTTNLAQTLGLRAPPTC